MEYIGGYRWMAPVWYGVVITPNSIIGYRYAATITLIRHC